VYNVPSNCELNAVESSRGTAELAPMMELTCVIRVLKTSHSYLNEPEGSGSPRSPVQPQAIADYRSKTCRIMYAEGGARDSRMGR